MSDQDAPDLSQKQIFNGMTEFNNSQYVAFTATAAQSAVIRDDIVRLFTTIDCWIQIGSNPTAVKPTSPAIRASHHFLPSGILHYIKIKPGDKISAISDGSVGGNLHITEGK